MQDLEIRLQQLLHQFAIRDSSIEAARQASKDVPEGTICRINCTSTAPDPGVSIEDQWDLFKNFNSFYKRGLRYSRNLGVKGNIISNSGCSNT